jgi:hypothetical protein
MPVHVLKSWPQFFQPILDGTRCHELRRNDRNFSVGDVLELHEYDPLSHSYSGRVCSADVTSMTSNEVPCAVSDVALNPDFAILSIKTARR